VASAKLRIERTTVAAPISGKVLALVAKPGSKLMGLDRAALTDASTVISMYDPHQLQVRADVRLENVPSVQVGQAVRIETPAAAEVIQGHVLAMTSLTDIQKNTLQIKIAIDEPPPVLKPDMLVEATFLSPPTGNSTQPATPQVWLLVPADLIDSTGQTPQVWVADVAAKKARRKSIQLGHPQADGMIEVVSGLSVGDRLIAGGREQLEPDCRIKVTGDAPAVSSELTRPPHHQDQKKPQRIY
jgi:multidrug efflux pump subunit AcrA (membrane-fusion protein)